MFPELAKHSEKLIYFVEIIHDGSLQGAGRRLGISAATLSYSIKELELATKVKLLNRSKKGISLTPAGTRLYDFCRTFYEQLDQIQVQILDLEKPVKRKIRIGTFSSIAIYFWPLLMKELTSQSKLSISLSTKRSLENLESLVKKDIDVALTVGTFHQKSIISHELYRDSYNFYVSNQFSSKKLSDQELKKHVLLYIPDAQDELGKNLRSYLHHWNLSFKEEFELDSFEVIGEFVKKGYGIGILPNRVAKNLGPSVVRIDMNSMSIKNFGEHRFYLSHRNDLELSQMDLDSLKIAAAKAVLKMG